MSLQLLSHLFSAPVVAFFVAIPFSLSSADPLLSFLISFLLLCVAPAITPFYHSLKKKVPLDIPEKEMRTPFFIIAVISYGLGLSLFYYMNYHLMFVLFLGYFITTVAMTMVNLLWKISVHAAAIAGPSTAFIYVFGLEYSWIFVFTIAVIYIRKKLNAHSIFQLLLGAFLGAVITAIIYFHFL